jgi:hypothetical protein
MAEVSAHKPGIEILLLHQIGDLHTLYYNTWVPLLDADNDLFGELQDGRADPMEDVVRYAFLIEL